MFELTTKKGFTFEDNLEATLIEMPGERPGEEPGEHPGDELAPRRRARVVGA